MRASDREWVEAQGRTVTSIDVPAEASETRIFWLQMGLLFGFVPA